MQAQAQGWYEATIPGACAGMLYKYRIDGEMEVPDPASHFQPQDVFGPSEIIDHKRFEWRTHQWRGRPWQDAAGFGLPVRTVPPVRAGPRPHPKSHHLGCGRGSTGSTVPVSHPYRARTQQ